MYAHKSGGRRLGGVGGRAGTLGVATTPNRVDALVGLNVVHVAAAKFHSAAVTKEGNVYTWGFGRGGRLGLPDCEVHSGQVCPPPHA
eukprot:scaffold3111_cov332-Prasinococcus_capsulatus_cf.AAC.9